MCGICGVVGAPQVLPIDEPELVAMRDALFHRGPDDAGHYLAPGIALGSRRLAILDLSERGHMPMSTPDGRYRIVYNGEVYNFAELRTELAGLGYTFRSDTDTEVVLRAYQLYGAAMLPRLNGMFSLAIWDGERRELFLARDRLGKKPLFFAEQGENLLFASEPKALFAAGIQAEFAADTLPELVCFRYVAGSRTPYAGIHRLLPGHWLLWRNGNYQVRRWWSLSQEIEARRASLPTRPDRWFAEVFDDSVERRCIADVPVGVLLSGGLDSGSVAASLAAHGHRKLASFTVAFPERHYDEGPLASAVAKHCGLDYHELRVGEEEIVEWLEKSSWMNDEPLAHSSSLHIWAISQYAKPLVTVLLSGEGGDETLGGYVRYQPLRFPRLLQASQPWVRLAARCYAGERIRKLSRFLHFGRLDRFVLFNSCDTLPDEMAALGMPVAEPFAYRESILDEARRLYPAEPIRQAMYADQHTFLCSLVDRNDRMTMGASIECREPFLDFRLVETLGALPTKTLIAGARTKHLLRKAVGKRLPREILSGRKWGFGVPWSAYLRRIPALRQLVQDLPDLPPLSDSGFDRHQLRAAVNQFLAGDRHRDELVRQLAMIAVWYQVCISARQGRTSHCASFATKVG